MKPYTVYVNARKYVVHAEHTIDAIQVALEVLYGDERPEWLAISAGRFLAGGVDDDARPLVGGGAP